MKFAQMSLCSSKDLVIVFLALKVLISAETRFYIGRLRPQTPPLPRRSPANERSGLQHAHQKPVEPQLRLSTALPAPQASIVIDPR